MVSSALLTDLVMTITSFFLNKIPSIKAVRFIIGVMIVLFTLSSCNKANSPEQTFGAAADKEPSVVSDTDPNYEPQSFSIPDPGISSSVTSPQEISIELDGQVTLSGNPFTQTTELDNEKTLVISQAKETLEPIQTTGITSTGYRYDEYRSSNGDLYGFFAGTDIFSYYHKNTGGSYIENTEVNTSLALSVADSFIKNIGFCVDSYTVSHSGDYSLDFTVTYQYFYKNTPTGEKIIIHLMADESGVPYVTKLRVYDYERCSKDTAFISESVDVDQLFITRDKTIKQEYPGQEVLKSSFLWKDEKDNICLKTLIKTDKETKYLITY